MTGLGEETTRSDSAADREDALLTVENLGTHFTTDEGIVRAVDGVSFHVDRGESLGIVGESGCGKTVANLSIMGLIPTPPGRIVSGSVSFDGRELLNLSHAELRSIRGNRIAMIFQDPMTSLNPFLRIERQMTEVLQVHRDQTRKAARETAADMLDRVGIPGAADRIFSYPHQFSGGMRQRVMIAMALSCRPELLIADEPTTALDVTIQAQILELIRDMRQELGMAMILITHDLGVVAGMCERIIVMYAGKIVEEAPVRQLYREPRHPYSLGLLRSVPRLDEKEKTSLDTISGQPPDLTALPAGCRFAPRCRFAEDRCREEEPLLREVADGRRIACFFDI